MDMTSEQISDFICNQTDILLHFCSCSFDLSCPKLKKEFFIGNWYIVVSLNSVLFFNLFVLMMHHQLMQTQMLVNLGSRYFYSLSHTT